MLHRIPKSSFQPQILIPPSKLLLLTPRNPLNESSFEHNYRNICNILLSITRSRSLFKGLELHSYIVKSGFLTIDRVCCYLINFYSKSQLPHCSRQIFEETPVKSAATWNYVISAFAQNELPSLAIDYFRRMLDDGVGPDDNIFPSTTKACGILSRCDIGQSVHSFAVKTGYDGDVFVGSSMVEMHAKCGEIRDARKMFDEMPERNAVSWSVMTCAYAQMGENEEALRLFKQSLVEDLEVNDFTFPSVVRVCGNSMLLELGN